jgi:hypothetical protein
LFLEAAEQAPAATFHAGAELSNIRLAMGHKTAPSSSGCLGICKQHQGHSYEHDATGDHLRISKARPKLRLITDIDELSQIKLSSTVVWVKSFDKVLL